MAPELNEILRRVEKAKSTGDYEHACTELIHFATDASRIDLLSNAFRNSNSLWVRHGILTAYEMTDHTYWDTKYEKLPPHCSEVILEDALIGIADKDERIRMKSSDIFSRAEGLFKEVNPELGERAVKVLLENSKRARESSVIEALGVADYSVVSPGTKKQAIDFLKNAALGGSSDAARGLDRIGDEDSKNEVRKHWLPKLDSKRERDIDRALNIFSELECKAAADKVVEIVKNGKKGFDYYNLNYVLRKSGDERHEATMLKLMRNERGHYCIADMEILGKKGWRKSLEVLNGILKNTKDYNGQERDAAKKAIKEIEGRMTVSSKPAEEKLRKAMEKKKVPA